MSSRDDDLALRKEVLLARAQLCRLKVAYHAGNLRRSLTWGHALAGAARSAPAREAALLLVAEGVGRHRVARWLSFAIRALAVARLTHLAVLMLKKDPADPPPA
ncbi:MAG: hypothetical protein AB7P08_14150 [Burkholderiales bacterium]